jgi:hypothetical protein
VRHTIVLNARITHKPQFYAISARVTALVTDPAAFADLLKGVAQETLLMLYMSRFGEVEARIAKMYRVGGHDDSGQYMQTMIARAAKVDTALERLKESVGNDGPGVAELKERSRKAHMRLGDAAGNDTDSVSGTVSKEGATAGLSEVTMEPGKGSRKEGQFHAAMEKVMQTLVDPKLMEATRTKTQLVLGIGDRNLLNAIETPSYYPAKTRYKIMWRHMEFGTGMFAKPGRRVTGPTKEGDGSWWYGPKKGQGLHLAGSQQGNILRKKGGEGYTEDQEQLIGGLHLALNRALRGRGA